VGSHTVPPHERDTQGEDPARVRAAWAFRGTSAGGGSGEPASAGKRFGAWLLNLVLAVVTLGIGWLGRDRVEGREEPRLSALAAQVCGRAASCS